MTCGIFSMDRYRLQFHVMWVFKSVPTRVSLILILRIDVKKKRPYTGYHFDFLLLNCKRSCMDLRLPRRDLALPWLDVSSLTTTISGSSSWNSSVSPSWAGAACTALAGMLTLGSSSRVRASASSLQSEKDVPTFINSSFLFGAPTKILGMYLVAVLCT